MANHIPTGQGLIILRHLLDDVSIHEIARRTGAHRATITKIRRMLDAGELASIVARLPRGCSIHTGNPPHPITAAALAAGLAARAEVGAAPVPCPPHPGAWSFEPARPWYTRPSNTEEDRS